VSNTSIRANPNALFIGDPANNSANSDGAHYNNRYMKHINSTDNEKQGEVQQPSPATETESRAAQPKAPKPGEAAKLCAITPTASPTPVKRTPLSAATVEQYAKALRDGAQNPAIRVCKVGDGYVLFDGCFRLAARRNCRRS
jgi:hypothetical protein